MRYLIISALVCCVVVSLLSGVPVFAVAESSHYGVVDQWGYEIPELGQGSMDIKLQNLGAKWIRTVVNWDQIEANGDNQYDANALALMDNTVTGMNILGVNIYYNFTYTPAWARPGGTTNATPPTDPSRYTDFITFMVNRYKDSIHYWGFWNEPNLSQFYNGTMTSYINNLLLPGIDAVKSADPTAKVVVGDLSTSGNDGAVLQQILTALTSSGKQNTVDIICHHSYDGNNTASGRLADMDTLRTMIVNQGYGNKDFWCTETGWQSSGTNGETNQANQIMAFMQGMDARPWWKKTFYYTMGEGAAGGFGLLRPDLSEKPSYTQLKSYISQMADSAQFVSDTIPTSMTAGQQYNVSVTMKNTGTISWNDLNVWKLGAVGDSDPFGPGRVYLNSGESIAPDQSKTFTFTMTAPTTAGTYTSDWRMVHEGVRWFGDTDLRVITVGSGGQSPYSGVISLPGTIQAENFDNGGEGVAYHDTDGVNSGGQYRTTGVDIESCSDTGTGYDIGWMFTGEWLEYTVNVASTGDYDFYVRVATPNNGMSFKILIDGTDVTGTRAFASTGGFQNWTTIIVPSRYLTAGQHVLQFNVVNGGFNLNKIDVMSRGADAISCDLDVNNINDGLTEVFGVSDGDTVGWTAAGHYMRENVDFPDYYMYFAVPDVWAYQGSKQSVKVTIDYYDIGTSSLSLNYDSTGGGAYKIVAGPALTNTLTFKQYTWNLSDAYFGNRENGGADFRVAVGTQQEWGLDTVCVYQ